MLTTVLSARVMRVTNGESLTHGHHNPELGESHRSQMAVFVYDSSSCSVYETNAREHEPLRKCLSCATWCEVS